MIPPLTMKHIRNWLLLIVLIITAACGSDQPARIPTSLPTPSRGATMTPLASPTVLPLTETPSPPTATPEPVSPAQLQASLLVIGDFPPGWEVRKTDPKLAGDEAATFPFLCQQLPRRSVEAVQSEFVKDALAPVATHRITVYVGGDAAQTFAEMSGAFQACPSWQSTDVNGVVHSWKAEPLYAAKLGEQTLAIRLTASSQSYGVVETEAVYFLYRNVLETIQYTNLGEGSVDQELLIRLAQTAASRLVEVLKP